eukprot:Nk52_evm32s2209 gene=Nk52_evmTU32s2209
MMHMNKLGIYTLVLLVVAFLILFSFNASDVVGAPTGEEFDEKFYAPWCSDCASKEAAALF